MDDVPLVEVAVWDRAVRVVHWLFVVLLVVLLASGLAGDDWLVWHMRAGYSMLTLVLFRVLWGFCGSRNARFGAFLRGPRAVGRYARSLARRAREMHATHNPLGGVDGRGAAGSRCSRNARSASSPTTTSCTRARSPGTSPRRCRMRCRACTGAAGG